MLRQCYFPSKAKDFSFRCIIVFYIHCTSKATQRLTWFRGRAVTLHQSTVNARFTRITCNSTEVRHASIAAPILKRPPKSVTIKLFCALHIVDVDLKMNDSTHHLPPMYRLLLHTFFLFKRSFILSIAELYIKNKNICSGFSQAYI